MIQHRISPINRALYVWSDNEDQMEQRRDLREFMMEHSIDMSWCRYKAVRGRTGNYYLRLWGKPKQMVLGYFT